MILPCHGVAPPAGVDGSKKDLNPNESDEIIITLNKVAARYCPIARSSLRAEREHNVHTKKEQ